MGLAGQEALPAPENGGAVIQATQLWPGPQSAFQVQASDSDTNPAARRTSLLKGGHHSQRDSRTLDAGYQLRGPQAPIAVTQWLHTGIP